LFSNLANGNSWNLNPIATTSQIVLKSTRNNIVLTVTHANGCVASTPPVSVVVDTLPVVTLLKDTALVFGEDIDLVASNFSANAQSFSWLLNGLQIGNSSLPSFGIEPTATATYSVILTDSNGCRASDSVLIRVARELYVPNMFSPNKDGNNDRFKVYGFGIASIEVKVWDRLGNLVYETNRVEDIVESSIDGDSVPGWDGTYKGKELSQESFIWNVKGKLTTGEDLKVNGGKNSGSVIIMN
jgi:gliding motility-associated-like protein